MLQGARIYSFVANFTVFHLISDMYDLASSDCFIPWLHDLQGLFTSFFSLVFKVDIIH